MISTRDRRQFDDLLDRVIAELPPRLHELLEEVPLIVEDEPSETLLEEVMGESDGDLCGLHWGTSLTERSVEAPGDIPDCMMLFRGPILRLSGCTGIDRGRGGTAELYRQIKITLLHEIGHHFGLDEDGLAELGYA
jgi:predicted Zn-dependent protease with MMP-like domain